MKATQVGSGNTDTPLFNWFHYVRIKYDGLFPENFPTQQQIQEVSHQALQAFGPEKARLLRERQKLTKLVKSVQREWMKQQ